MPSQRERSLIGSLNKLSDANQSMDFTISLLFEQIRRAHERAYLATHALRTLYRIMYHYGHDGCPCQENTCEWVEALDMARTAIDELCGGDEDPNVEPDPEKR